MLPRLLALPVLALTLISASAQSFPLDTTDQTSLQPPSREVILPCARCAFAEAKCSKDTPHGTDSDGNGYLTITLSVEKNVLLANQHVVFPPSLPMEFSALRHNTSSGHDESVTVSYVLDARPIPIPILGRKTNTGEVYLLKMKLLDSTGNLASDQMVLVGVISSVDGSGSLGITEVNTAPIHAHHRPRPSNKPIKAWFMAITSSAKESIRVWAISSSSNNHPHPHHQQQQSKPKPKPKHNNDDALSSDSKTNTDPHRTVDHRSHHAWHGHGHAHSLNRDFGRLVRPVLVPALLGAGTGIVVCVMGFLIGRVVVTVYYCMRGEGGRTRRRRSVRVPVVMVQGYDCEDGYEYGYDLEEREMLLRGKVEEEER